jgi:ATP-dependent helicase/nuclease subunit A
LLAPSHDDAETELAHSPQARRHGTLLHRLLQYRSAGYDRAQVQAALQREWPTLPSLDAAWHTVEAVLAAPALRRFYDPAHYERAYNELPLLYQRADQAVYGVIDRVVVTREEVMVLDYKTHADADPENSTRYAPVYFPQLRLYAAGVQQLWPERRVRAYLVFTACAAQVEEPLA